MKTQKGASQLTDLDVDRVDAVDKPATGRSFLLFKGEADAEQILKGYGMVATAASAVLSKMRTDKNAVVSRKSAVALNGLAQVLGQDAVFVGKSVPTQPYLFTEPDADKRGPADEDLGGNFTPRAMPGSMVGSVQFRLKEDEEPDADDEDEDKKPWEKTARSAAKFAADKAAKAAKDADGDADDSDMDASEKANRGVARSIEAMAKGIESLAKSMADLPAAIVKAEKAEIAKMQGGDDEGEGDAEPVKKTAKSRQIADDEPVAVRKGRGEDLRMGVSFGNVVFGGKR